MNPSTPGIYCSAGEVVVYSRSSSLTFGSGGTLRLDGWNWTSNTLGEIISFLFNMFINMTYLGY